MSRHDERMSRRIAHRVISGPSKGRSKTAGEVRFVKDFTVGDGRREIPGDFDYDPKFLKKLTRILWGISCAHGHLVSAHTMFTKIKSVRISPDGNLGGSGYVQPISNLRKGLTDSIERLSGLIDTLDDEVKADHWQENRSDLDPQDDAEVDEMISDSEEIMDDPEGYVDEEYEEGIEDDVAVEAE